MKNMIGIYAIFRKSDNKCMYVGQSKDVQRRLREHFSENRKSASYNYNEYYHKILETFDDIDKDTKLNKEADWIEKLNPENNIIRNRHFKLTDEQIKKYSDKNRGKKRTEEQRKRINDSHKGQIPWNKGKRGVYSEETLNKMRNSRKGKKLNKDTGNYE